MSETATRLRNVERGETFEIRDPEVGEVSVFATEPQQSTTMADGVVHFVFTHESGRMIGLNWTPPQGAGDWSDCILVADEDGYHHGLITTTDGETVLVTRREPGRPDDWEIRGAVSDLVSKPEC